MSREVKTLGGKNVKSLKRAVAAEGDIGFIYKANIWLRSALRVLVQVQEGFARDEKELYRLVKSVDWENIFAVDKSFAIDVTLYASQFHNSLFLAQKAKDAIADRFRERTGKRPSVNLKQPEVRINVHISNKRCQISLDSSGDSLHKRRYRRSVDVAPINEVLAAGIILLSDWDGQSSLVDPMCGSGTFLIEAAMIAYNIPPNVFREDFCFKHWRNYDAELFQLIFDKSLEKERSFNGEIIGMDVDRRALQKAKNNIERALMQDQIKLLQADLTDLPSELNLPDKGTVVVNPPYDKKIPAAVEELYLEMSNSFKDHFQGYSVWVFSASETGLKNIHLKASRKFTLKNAQLPSWLVGYPIYQPKPENQ